MEFEIRYLDLQTLSEADWIQGFVFRRAMHEVSTPDDPYLPDEQWRAGMMYQLEEGGMELQVLSVSVDDKMIATANISWMTPEAAGYEQNKSVCFCEISVLPEYRGQGIARQLLAELTKIAKENGKQVMIGGTVEPVGIEFIKAIGGAEALANVDNRLVLDEVDWTMVRSWTDEGRDRNPDTLLEELEPVPENRMNAFVKVFDSTLRQVPTGDLEMEMTVDANEVRKGEAIRKKLGRIQLKLVTTEPDGEMSGVTWLMYEPKLPTILYQGLTGVVEHHRGRGLGKWLKAEALLLARQRFPEVKYIKTDNATTNAPMISINERLGFCEFRRNYNLQVSVEAVEQYLSGQQVSIH